MRPKEKCELVGATHPTPILSLIKSKPNSAISAKLLHELLTSPSFTFLNLMAVVLWFSMWGGLVLHIRITRGACCNAQATPKIQ